MRLLIAYAAAAIVFLACDLVWLGLVARDFYRSQMGDLMATEFVTSAAIGFYLLYVAGIVYFAVAPALAAGAWTTALISGFLFGLIAYATYDLTNLATTRGWPTALAFVDMGWGATLTAISATAAYFVTRALSPG